MKSRVITGLVILALALLLAIAGQTPLQARISAPGGAPAPRGAAVAAAAEPSSYPGAPAYDSGWVAIAPDQERQFQHALGGSVDNYVVDLRFSTEPSGTPYYGQNQVNYGGNQVVSPAPSGYQVGDRVGAFWRALNTNSINVYRHPQDKSAPFVRVRIWVTTSHDWDSGWHTLAQGATYAPAFNIAGGAADNYLVYLEFKDTPGNGIHQMNYGGSTLAALEQGAYWRNLTNTSIQVTRRLEDNVVDQVRVRIFNRPKATYDSGWQVLDAGSYRVYGLSIHGNPDDYIVDVQFYDSDDGSGVNQRCYGTCDIPGTTLFPLPKKRGARWQGLGGDVVSAYRAVDDVYADQVRVRIWNIWTPPRPDYDSGWKTSSAGALETVPHNLGGSEDDYLVNLVFNQTAFYGINQMYYGMKTFGTNPPAGYSTHESGGAYWFALTNSSMVVRRGTDDRTADQWRTRIWRMPKPDYDSGWTPLPAGAPLSLVHGLDGSPPDFLVDLTFQDAGSANGKHQMFFGGRADTASHLSYGAYWDTFLTGPNFRQISVVRLPTDTVADLGRVRIWRTNRPVVNRTDSYAPGQVRTLTGLSPIDPDNVLVDATAIQGSAAHKRFYGRMDVGPEPLWDIYSPNWRLGFNWYLLHGDSVTVRRLEEDMSAETITVRIWSLPGEPALTGLYVPLINR